MFLIADAGPDTGACPPPDGGPTGGGSADENLLFEASKGELKAFEEVVRRHQASLVRFLERLIGNRADAEDVAQEAFLAALRKSSSFKGRASVRSWLFAIAKNIARDFLRSRIRRRNRELARSVAIEDKPTQESGRWIRNLLDLLPPKLREALLVCDVFGFTYEEASDVLACPVKTVSTRLFRARERMVEILKAENLK